MAWYPCGACCCPVIADVIGILNFNCIADHTLEVELNGTVIGNHIGNANVDEDERTTIPPRYTYFTSSELFDAASWEDETPAVDEFSAPQTPDRVTHVIDGNTWISGVNTLILRTLDNNDIDNEFQVVVFRAILRGGIWETMLDSINETFATPLTTPIDTSPIEESWEWQQAPSPNNCDQTPIFSNLNPEPIEFGFTTAALVGLGALESEEVTATFTVSGVLTIVGTVEQIAGSSNWAFTTAGDLDGSVSCSGTTTLTHTCTGSLAGSRGALDGECNSVFTTLCAAHASARLQGQSNVAFSNVGALRGVLELTGNTGPQFTTIAQLRGRWPHLASTVNVVFSTSGALGGSRLITGTTTLTATTSADLNGALELTGDTALQFTTVADLNGALEITGDTSVQFTTAADLNGELEITGNTSAQFTTSAALTLDAPISASTSLSFFNVTGDLNGELEISGNTGAQFTVSAAATVETDLTGNTSLTFTTQGDVDGELELTSDTGLQFTTSAAGTLRGRLVGNAQVSFSTQGALTDIGGGEGCEHCAGAFPTQKVVRLCGTITDSSCSLCVDLTGDWTLTDDTVTEQSCLLEYNDDTFPCGTLNMQLRFFATEISFDISIGTLSGSAQFLKTGLSAPYDCTEAVDGEYTLNFASSSECDFSGMTVLVNPPPVECEHCTFTPPTLTLIFGDGFANMNCEDCAFVGNTFFLANDPCGDPCVYTYSGTSPCGNVLVTIILGETQITGSIEIDNQEHATLSANVTAPYNGASLRTLTVSAPGGGSTACDLTGITSATLEG